MLRAEVIVEWNNLKETIRDHHQYQWGRLLTNLSIRVFAPQLSLELITREIKDKLKDNPEIRSLRNEKQAWQSKLDALKRKANERHLLVMGGDSANLRAMQERFEDLRTLINSFTDDESGPTIEEVD